MADNSAPRRTESADALRRLNVEPMFVRPDVACQLLGVSIDKFREMMAAGELPPEQQFGRAVAHRLADLKLWSELGCPSKTTFVKLKDAKK